MTATDAARCILVVDDSEGTRFVFANWLRRAGYTVHEATTGAEAIDLLARIRFDVVLLDVNLPDMSGFDVCTHIKSTRRTAAIPVLHVSATATGPDDRSTGLIRGADGYLVEPIERDELLATVIALLRYHEARRAAERLAARLEQLHQVTLLINAASSVAELTRLASSGAAAIFGASAIVLAARDGRGWVAKTFPDDVEAVLRFCDPAAVLALAGAAAAHERVDLGAIGPGFTAHPQSAIHASPLTTPRGELVGAVVLLSGPSGFDDGLMDHFCQAVAVAFENQRLYAVEHQIALTLQQAMLPQSLPQPADLDIAVRYQAASDTVEIGGDFYEAIELDDRVLLAIGDVAGHSLRAATVMAELRYSLRAFATLGLRPAEIIDRLGTILCDFHAGLTATMCIVEIERSAPEIRITNAGHIPPFLYDGRRGRFIEPSGPMLGLGLTVETPTVTTAFGLGDIVVLATDGLVERRDEVIDVGLDRLSSVVLGHRGDPASLCERLLREVGAGDATFDDIAILVARRTI